MIYKFRDRNVPEDYKLEVEKTQNTVRISIETNDESFDFDLEPKEINKLRDALYDIETEFEKEERKKSKSETTN